MGYYYRNSPKYNTHPSIIRTHDLTIIFWKNSYTRVKYAGSFLSDDKLNIRENRLCVNPLRGKLK